MIIQALSIALSSFANYYIKLFNFFMTKKYLKYTFWLYYVVFTLFILTSIFSMLFPIEINREPTRLSSVSPFFYIIFYFYPFVCGLVGVVLNLEKHDKTSKIVGAIVNFFLYFGLTCLFYFVSIFIFPSLISAIFQGVPYQFGFLIGFNIVNILHFWLFEFLKKTA